MYSLPKKQIPSGVALWEYYFPRVVKSFWIPRFYAMNVNCEAALTLSFFILQNVQMNRTASNVNSNVLDTAETTIRVTRSLVSVIKVVLMDGTVYIVNIDVLVTVITVLYVIRRMELVTEDVLLDGLVLFVKKVTFIYKKKTLKKRFMSIICIWRCLRIKACYVNIEEHV